MAARAITFKGTIDIRFSDLDEYGHVNAKNYLDFVATTRLRFLNEHTGVSSRELIQRGFAFYLAKSETRYRRPITGMGTILVESFVEEVIGSDFVIRFIIMSEDREIQFADGTVTYAAVDYQTGKRIGEIPSWITGLFFDDVLAS